MLFFNFTIFVKRLWAPVKALTKLIYYYYYTVCFSVAVASQKKQSVLVGVAFHCYSIGHVSLSVTHTHTHTRTHTHTCSRQQLASDLLEGQAWRFIMWQSSDDTLSLQQQFRLNDNSKWSGENCLRALTWNTVLLMCILTNTLCTPPSLTYCVWLCYKSWIGL